MTSHEFYLDLPCFKITLCLIGHDLTKYKLVFLSKKLYPTKPWWIPFAELKTSVTKIELDVRLTKMHSKLKSS